MPTVLITGSTGFIGAAVARPLRTNYDVIELNRRHAQPPCNSHVWDFRAALPTGLPSRVDVVVHAAATTGRDVPDPDRECFEINAHATAKLLQYAARAGTKSFVYISTGSVYALSPYPSRETDPVAPEGHYAASKAAAEALVAGYRDTMATSCLRLFHPYGPGQRSQYLIPRFVERIRSRQSISLNGAAGRPTINPLFIDDAVEWIRRVVETQTSGTFNLAGPENVTIRALAERLAAMLGKPAKFDVGREAPGDRLGDIERITEVTGYAPSYDIERGLRAMLGGQSRLAA